jgi:hypothetical protein
MAIINAIASGSYSDVATVFGGITPQPGDTVRTNAFTITLDIPVTGINFQANGGGLVVGDAQVAANAGLLIFTNCNLDYLGTSATSGITVTLSEGEFQWLGAINNNSNTASRTAATLTVSGSATVRITSVRGGNNTTTPGASLSGFIGGVPNLYIGTAEGGTLGDGLVLPFSYGNTGQVTRRKIYVTNAIGGNSSGARGIASTQAGNYELFVENATPNVGPACFFDTSGGNISAYITNAYASDGGLGSAFPRQFGIVNNNVASSSTFIFVTNWFYGQRGLPPTLGTVFLDPKPTNTVRFTLENGTTKTLADPATFADSPAPANVRFGIAYNYGNNVGTCAVPLPGQTVVGVPVDNTVGTAVLTTAGISSALTPITNQLDDIETTLATIQAKTDTIGTGSVSIQSPVNQTGELQTLIVGDAYQLAAGRAITINVLNVAAGLQTILSAGATVHLGFRSFGKSRQSPEFRRYEFAGTIVSVAATTVVRFELTTAQTKGILPGQYDYDIEFRQSGNYVTSVSNAEDVPMSWRESSTTLPA